LSKITFFKSSSYPMCQLQSNPRVEFNNHTAGSRREIPHEQHHVFMLKLLAWPFTWCFLEEILVNYDIIWSIVGLVYLAILCTAPLDVLHSTSQIPQDATLSILSSSLVCNRPCGTNRVCITPTQLCTYSDSRLTQPITSGYQNLVIPETDTVSLHFCASNPTSFDKQNYSWNSQNPQCIYFTSGTHQ
jgi:hypothetical protein